MSDVPIRVLIADDHLIVREGLRLIMETDAQIMPVGEAVDGAEAVRLAAELQPDVILMDLRMPGMDGLAAIRQIKSRQPEIEIVILTTYNEDDLMIEGLQAGARAYLLKDTGRVGLFETIRAAARGETLLKPDIMARLMLHTGLAVESPAAGEAAQGGPALTDREREVLAAAADGERNKEIAFRLGISERTVKAHLTSVYNKLGVDSRAAAVAVAVQRGILQPGGED